MNGKGKGYYDNGKLLFEGEYSKHFKKKGKEYDINGKIMYEGEYMVCKYPIQQPYASCYFPKRINLPKNPYNPMMNPYYPMMNPYYPVP